MCAVASEGKQQGRDGGVGRGNQVLGLSGSLFAGAMRGKDGGREIPPYQGHR